MKTLQNGITLVFESKFHLKFYFFQRIRFGSFVEKDKKIVWPIFMELKMKKGQVSQNKIFGNVFVIP